MFLVFTDYPTLSSLRRWRRGGTVRQSETGRAITRDPSTFGIIRSLFIKFVQQTKEETTKHKPAFNCDSFYESRAARRYEIYGDGTGTYVGVPSVHVTWNCQDNTCPCGSRKTLVSSPVPWVPQHRCTPKWPLFETFPSQVSRSEDHLDKPNTNGS